MTKSYREATAVWRQERVFDAVSKAGAELRMDGGGASGFSPMELLLVGLAGCTGADVADILRKKRQDVTAFEVRVRGERAEEHPRKYTDINVRYVVTGRGLDPAAVHRAVELSETKYCSVSATLKGVARITTDIEIHEAEPAPA